jgi:Tol biopolymer transport system component
MVMKHLLLAAIALVVVFAGADVGAQSGYDLFQKALATERADGNLREAIQMYERVVKQFASDRPLVARALVRIADCQEKLGQRDAAKVYERIVREFSDQADSVGVARARLSALQAPALPAVQAVRKIWSGGEVDGMGAPSADGRFMSFTSWDTGDLAIRDLAAGTNRLVTNTGGWDANGDYAEYSVLSPDARQVAYAWFIEKGGDPKAKCVCRYELRVMSITGADAGKPRVLLRGDTQDFWAQPAAFTPDGKGLLVLRTPARGRHEIGMLTLADNNVRVLTSVSGQKPERLSLSPDGRFIAFDNPPSSDAAARDIVLMAASGGPEVAAVQSPANDYSPVFSHDGSQLLFLSDRTGSEALWRLPLVEGKPAGPPVMVSSVTARSTILGATRSGGAYYWTAGPGANVYTVDLDQARSARGEPRLLIDRFLNANSAPAFSPDGKFVAYHSRRGGIRNGEGTLVIHSLATRQDRDVPSPDRPLMHTSWFPDSQHLLIAVRDPLNRLHYHRANISTGEQELLMSTQGGGLPQARPQLSPDGKTIYFVDRITSVEPVKWLLGRYDIATRQTTELRTIRDDGAFTSFQISRDGTELAYLRTDDAYRGSILEVMPTGGGPAREIFREKNLGPGRYSGLAWSPDNKHVFVVRDNNLGPTGGQPGGSLWKVPAAGGTPEPTGIAMPGMIRFPNVDPTGTKLVFAAAGGPEAAIWAVENFLPRK